MRSVEEQMREISRRKKRYEDARKGRTYAVTGAGLLMALIVVIAVAPGAASVIEQNRMTVLGSTILGAKTGSYVLVALTAFTLGVFATLFSRQYRKNKTDRKKEDD